MNPSDLESPSEHRIAMAGAAVSRLSIPEPPKDLASRTLKRIAAEYMPVKRVFWYLRPITNPLARLAAAAAIIFLMVPLTDLSIAAPLGARIEENILGTRTTEQIEGMMDALLVRYGTTSYSQAYLDAFMGDPRPLAVRFIRKLPSKSRI